MILIREVLLVVLLVVTGAFSTRHGDGRLAGSELPSLPPVGSKPLAPPAGRGIQPMPPVGTKPLTPPAGGRIQPTPPVGETMPGVGAPPSTFPPANGGTMPIDMGRPPQQ